jgi:hypothetical protein
MVRKIMQNNPLRKYFRQPAIYIKLPSNGNFYEPGTLDMPPNRELPVFPMTAMDEITYRTADALFNGTAIVSVIQSCVPNIRDAWKIPATDIDAILIAIRIASFGHEMDFESDCPYCQHENSFGLDLRLVMEQIQVGNYSESIKQGDIEIFLKPLTYDQINANSLAQYEDQKLIEMLPTADLSEEEKMRRINEAFLKLSRMTIDAIAHSIGLVRAGNENVVETEFIREFMNNCDRDLFNRVRDRIIELRDAAELKPLKIQCQGCQKEYETPFTLNVTNFFGSAS